jgi:general secretion pathway protein K
MILVKRWFRLVAARHRARHARDRQSGVALLLTISTLALLVAVVSEFTFETHIQAAQAANARDELRAHYLARSSISLSRLLIKIQTRFVDPIMAQAQNMMKQASAGAGAAAGAAGAAGGSAGGDLGISLRVTDYAGTIMGFFGGSKEEVAALGGLIGLNTTDAKGLGLSGGSMDAEITAEDGKIDINCGGGSAPVRTRQTTTFRLLAALVSAPRYNRLFQEMNNEGQFLDRLDVARAIIDWADADEQMFNIDANSAGPEDYRYDARKDKYRAHNNSYDTPDEVALVKGMDARLLEAFLPYLTVYASDPKQQCRVNLASVKGDCAPLLVGLIRAAAMRDPNKPPQDPTILDDARVFPLASILCERGTAVGFDSLDTIVSVLSNPQMSIARDDPRHQLMQTMRGIQITRQELEQVAYIGAPRVYRIVATGESGKVKKKITAVLDTGRGIDNPVTQNPQSERASGVLQYWREE